MADWIAHADEVVHHIYKLTYDLTYYEEWIGGWGILRPFVSLLTWPKYLRLQRQIKCANDQLTSRFRKWLDLHHPDRNRRTDLDADDSDSDCLCDCSDDDESSTQFQAVKK